jgi:CRISPR-associated protein Cas1
MTKRILDFSEAPARLHVRYRQLVVERPETKDVTVPLDDLAVVVVSHPQVSYTQSVLAGLAEAGGTFIACNQKHLPVGMFLPLAAHFAQAERFAAQARASVPTKKRLWQQIIRAKICSQAEALEALYGTDHGLRVLIPQVRAGDPGNVEAQAARRYWSRLFANMDFRRHREDEDQNLLLNYGYALLRAIVARAICGAGLHPSLGLHHHNRYSAYCLADDLMEPFRPFVDRSVATYVGEHDAIMGLEPEAKRHLVKELTGRYLLDGQQRTLFDVAARTAGSLVDVLMGNARTLELPQGGAPCHGEN